MYRRGPTLTDHIPKRETHTVTHKFQLGQQVRFSRGHPLQTITAGVYEIMRQLPARDGDNEYRIKSVSEHHERVVREEDLEAAFRQEPIEAAIAPN